MELSEYTFRVIRSDGAASGKTAEEVVEALRHKRVTKIVGARRASNILLPPKDVIGLLRRVAGNEIDELLAGVKILGDEGAEEPDDRKDQTSKV